MNNIKNRLSANEPFLHKKEVWNEESNRKKEKRKLESKVKWIWGSWVNFLDKFVIAFPAQRQKIFSLGRSNSREKKDKRKPEVEENKWNFLAEPICLSVREFHQGTKYEIVVAIPLTQPAEKKTS